MPATTTNRVISVVFSLGIAAAAGCVHPGDVAPADLVLRGGRVVTVDAGLPEAEAVAVRGHEIVAVGSDEEIHAYVGAETDVIDLEGRLAIPGFIDGHAHFMSLGESLQALDLRNKSSFGEIVERIAGAAGAVPHGEWIFGHGWHQEKWAETPEPNVDGVPLHGVLSAVSPDNPVVLEHASGHALFVNAATLEAVGIDRDTPDPPGGTIVRGGDGEPTGLLRENAMDAVYAAVETWRGQRPAEERAAAARRTMEMAGREALSKGVTSFQDAGSSFEQIDRFREWADQGVLPVRLYVMVELGAPNEELDARLPDYRILPEGNAFLAVRSIKRMIDGAAGSHGAWLLEPYADMPDSIGLVVQEPELIEETARIAMRHGFQLNTHAIGARANRVMLDTYERVFSENPGATDLRWRIEHAQHVHPDDVPRFARLGVLAAMQGVHCASDGPWVPDRFGDERAGEQTYVWRDFLDAGTVIANGTDAPVEDVDPIASFHASVTRQMHSGELFHPEQAMTREEALRSYTIDAAYAAFEEHLKGSITPGKLADIVVLSEDIMTVPDDEIRTAEVDYTIVGGEIRYRRQ